MCVKTALPSPLELIGVLHRRRHDPILNSPTQPNPFSLRLGSEAGGAAQGLD